MYSVTEKALSSKWSLRFLTPNNISLYLDTSNFPEGFSSSAPAHQADYIRLRLLNLYGGWWIDLAIMITSTTLLDSYLTEIQDKKAQLFGYCFDFCPRHYIEVSFLYAPRGSAVIGVWLEEYEKLLRIGKGNYIYNTFRDGISIPFRVFYKYPHASLYMGLNVAQEVTLHRRIPRKTQLLTYSARKTFYKWRQGCSIGNYTCMKNRANSELVQQIYPITKINNHVRREIWKYQSDSKGFQLETKPLVTGISVTLLNTNVSFVWLLFFLILFILIPANCLLYLLPTLRPRQKRYHAD